MDSAFLERFRNRLAEQSKTDSENVLAGRMKDHTEYRYACGYFKGLHDAEVIAAELIKEIQGET